MKFAAALFVSLAGLALGQDGGVTVTGGAAGTTTTTTRAVTSGSAVAASTSRATQTSGSSTATATVRDSSSEDRDRGPRLPAGRQNVRGSLTGDIPLACMLPCSERLGNYYFCYETESSPRPNKVAFCDRLFCNQETYDHLRNCLNCILANGAASTVTVPGTTTLPGPVDRLDQEGAGEWLKTVGEQCAAHGSAVQTTTLTAVPTTTGPYVTSWTSGGTVDLPVWTGVTQYTEAIFRATRTPTPGESTGLTIPTEGTASSSAAPAASSTGAASRHRSVPRPLGFLAGMITG